MQLPNVFADIVIDAIPGMLKHQHPDGSIVYDPSAPIIYPQQAIFPLAFAFAGLDPGRRYHKSPEVAAAIRKLGDFLLSRTKENGEIHFDSNGYEVKAVDQRLTQAWTDALRILRDAGGDFAFEAWGNRILAACRTLMAHRMERLVGVRRFTGRVMGTSTNHVALYVTTVYLAGKVLNQPELCNFALPIGRAMAADVHPDGYWDEHSDLLRTAGPTPSYNYLTHDAMSLMYEWTGEAVFGQAIEKSTRFHANFSYPDATFIDTIDERVRQHRDAPRVWGLFGFSHSAVGRGSALAHVENWVKKNPNRENLAPEAAARFCENFLYWHDGPVAPAPFEDPDHRARLVLPAGLFRRGSWAVALSAMAATNAEDPGYRENPFALERQKLFSVWHEKTGLLIDGSNSKSQLENSTFSAKGEYASDYYPCGGAVGEDGGDFVVRAAYKSFHGNVRVRVLSDSTLQITLSADFAGTRGPITAGFTLFPIAGEVEVAGASHALGEQPFEVAGSRVKLGPATISGPDDMRITWPMAPFNSYSATHKGSVKSWMLRVHVALTQERPGATLTLAID